MIGAKAMRALLQAGQRPRRGHVHAFRDTVERALTGFITDTGNVRIKVVPSQLKTALSKIEQAADHLATLLAKHREAQDAMIRALRPHAFTKDPPFIGPSAAPEFELRALEIMDAAQKAKASNLAALPYVRAGRDRQAVNELIAALIVAWNEHFEERATFHGGKRSSAFVAFAQACCARVGARTQSSEALAKTCSRLEKKIPKTIPAVK